MFAVPVTHFYTQYSLTGQFQAAALEAVLMLFIWRANPARASTSQTRAWTLGVHCPVV